jgi:hypothetical protein
MLAAPAGFDPRNGGHQAGGQACLGPGLRGQRLAQQGRIIGACGTSPRTSPKRQKRCHNHCRTKGISGHDRIMASRVPTIGVPIPRDGRASVCRNRHPFAGLLRACQGRTLVAMPFANPHAIPETCHDHS